MRMPRTVGQKRLLGFEVAMAQGTQLMINEPHLAPFEVFFCGWEVLWFFNMDR